MSEKIGFSPELRESLSAIGAGLSGDIVINILTADDAPVPASTAWTKIISFELQTAGGKLHDWANGTITATPSDTSTAGTATVSDGTPSVVAGVGTVTLIGDAQNWLDTETALCTLGGTFGAKTLANVAFTRTYTA